MTRQTALLPDTQAALADGRIGESRAKVAIRKAAEVKDREDGELLVKQIDQIASSAGQVMDRNRLAREIDSELAKTDMDVLAERERTAFQRRSLTWSVRDGMHVLHAELDAVAGTRVRAMLDSLSDKTDDRDTRTYSQRQCDALVHMATLAESNRGRPQGTLQSARVLLITTPDALHGVEGAEPATIDGHGPVSTQLARQLCCDRLGGRRHRRSGETLLYRSRRDAGPSPKPAGVSVGKGSWAAPTEANSRVPAERSTAGGSPWRAAGRCAREPPHTNIYQHGWQITKDATGRYRAAPPGPPISALLEKCIEQTEGWQRTG